MFKLRRLSQEPILEPIAEHSWEREAVFNCGVTFHQGRVHMIYRASDRDFSALSDLEPKANKRFISSFGYGVSEDGINFTREAEPIFTAEGEQEAWGVEDPRISKIGDTFYMLYTAFGGRTWDDHKISLASSQDLETWQRHGVILDEPNKDAGLLEELVDGKYMLFHRRMPHIWAAFSSDLNTWDDHRIVMKTIPGGWEENKIGIAGQPIRVRQGFLMLYHAVDNRKVYRLGAALLDGEDPTKVVRRLPQPILEPELDWERTGHVPNVVFSCGQVIKDDFLYVYYGGADKVIGVAGIELDKVVF
ncbi:MAG: glycosidase [Firmicutes bacterium]|nr:glycosidase [Bacillota bacterium]